MRVHFIAIGGSAMHNLAIALHKKGYTISGSDDEIFEPSKSHLEKFGILPKRNGWNPHLITSDIDAVILGMHARIDNPELIKAKNLGLNIYSFPEFIFNQSKDKIRVVIGGSHGKTTITAMILHVLNHCNKDADYMVGAQFEGFDVMVKLSDNAPLIILEGDEYLTSPIDRRPKFHVYKPHIGLISGIAWDHMNVFPTYKNYVEQFKIFANLIEKNGILVYNRLDYNVASIANSCQPIIKKIPYELPNYNIVDGKTYLLIDGQKIPLKVFGDHNLQNIMGAMNICCELGIQKKEFLTAIQTFSGASKRLELVGSNESCSIYKDFAHSPSKLKATIDALKNQFPDRKLVACMELHTFSSLNATFLKEYANSMDKADTKIIYFNPHTIKQKRLPPLSSDKIKQSFRDEHLEIYTEKEKIEHKLINYNWEKRNLLMMSSGNFGGMKIHDISKKLLKQ